MNAASFPTCLGLYFAVGWWLALVSASRARSTPAVITGKGYSGSCFELTLLPHGARWRYHPAAPAKPMPDPCTTAIARPVNTGRHGRGPAAGWLLAADTSASSRAARPHAAHRAGPRRRPGEVPASGAAGTGWCGDLSRTVLRPGCRVVPGGQPRPGSAPSPDRVTGTATPQAPRQTPASVAKPPRRAHSPAARRTWRSRMGSCTRRECCSAP